MKAISRIRWPASLSTLCATAALTMHPALGADWQSEVNQIIGWKGQQMPDNVLRYIHMSGFGDPVELARAVKTKLAAARLPLHKDDDEKDADDTAPGLDVGELEEIMKTSSVAVDGVLEVTFDRPESYVLDGHALPSAMGPESEVHLQSIGEGRAMQVAELAVLAEEVPKVLQVLHAAGQQTDVSALHNHFITEEPRLLFLHTWGVGKQADLARTLRSAIDQTAQK